MPSAVIVRARLPSGLERLRRTSIPNATDGVPAHLTLLYPFVEPTDLDRSVRRRLAAIASHHEAFEYRLGGLGIWPDTLYVAVQPARPFTGLQRELQAAFPDFPIYGEDPSFVFDPHVSIAEGDAVRDAAVLRHPAWGDLPRSARATSLEVIAAGADRRWRLVWRLRLGRSAREPVGRMPA